MKREARLLDRERTSPGARRLAREKERGPESRTTERAPRPEGVARETMVSSLCAVGRADNFHPLVVTGTLALREVPPIGGVLVENLAVRGV